MKIVTIVGTSRPGNLTSKALAVVEDELTALGANVHRFDPVGKVIPFPGTSNSSDIEELVERIQAADGLVLATPEYHGGFAAQLKLIIEALGFPSPLGGKPIALMGVAGGRIGAIKSLEQLRSVCSHTGALVLPGPVSIAGVNRVFDDAGNCSDPASGAALRSVAASLVDYLKQHVCPRRSLEAMTRQSD